MNEDLNERRAKTRTDVVRRMQKGNIRSPNVSSKYKEDVATRLIAKSALFQWYSDIDEFSAQLANRENNGSIRSFRRLDFSKSLGGNNRRTRKLESTLRFCEKLKI